MGTGFFFALFLVILIAAFIQGSTGFGFALITAPAVGLIDPTLLPFLIFFLMIPLNSYVVWRERSAVDVRGTSWIMVGRIAGTGGGLWVLLAISPDNLNLLVGISTVLAAMASLSAPAFEPGPRALIAVGTVTGITETATGIGGPALALAYQHRPAAVLRSTMAVCFLLGGIVSLIALAFSGRISSEAVRTALFFFPAMFLGGLLSNAAHRKLNGPLVRTFVLTFALISGAVVIVRGW